MRALVSARGLADDAPVQTADLHRLALGDDAFDGIVCGEVLEHLEDDRAALRELARVLRPGGAVVASVPANPWRYDWSDHWAGHRRRYTAEGLAERFAEAGFAAVEVTPYGFPLLGLYHRQVYRRLLKRRLAADGAHLGAPTGAMKWISPLVRAAFEFDTLFLGRRPGDFGLLALAARLPLDAPGERPAVGRFIAQAGTRAAARGLRLPERASARRKSRPTTRWLATSRKRSRAPRLRRARSSASSASRVIAAASAGASPAGTSSALRSCSSTSRAAGVSAVITGRPTDIAW